MRGSKQQGGRVPFICHISRYSNSTSALLSLLFCEAWIGISVSWQSSVGWRQKSSLCSTDISRSLLPFSFNPPRPSYFFSPFLSLPGRVPLPPLFLIIVILLTCLCFAPSLLTIISDTKKHSERGVFVSVTAFGPMACHIRSLLIGVTRCQGTGNSHSTTEDVIEICLHSQEKSVRNRRSQENSALSSGRIWISFTVLFTRWNEKMVDWEES